MIRSGPPASGLGEVLTTPHRKKMALLRNRSVCLGSGLIFLYDLSREDNIKMDLQEVGWGVWAGLIWLRIGTVGGHL
jgi:hypothetical protein